MTTSIKSSIQFLTNPIDLPDLQMGTSSSRSNSTTSSIMSDSNFTSSSSVNSSSEDLTKYRTTTLTLDTPNQIKKQREFRKRRQRSGPSCDHCRSRKVKCDADINILTYEELDDFEKNVFHNKSRIVELDYQDNPIYKLNDHWRIVRTRLDNTVQYHEEYKYIKFKTCKKCSARNWNCRFSKGFTRIHSVNLVKSSISEESS